MELALTIGRNLARRRHILDLRQNEVAAKAGITQGYLSDIERGRETNVGLDTLNRLAEALGIGLPELLMESRDTNAVSAA